MNLNIGSVQLPINAATKTFALLAKRGAGKSYTGAVMAEEFAAAGIPFVVFDPIDVWWGLRLAANGKDKGLPVVVFGVEHADIHIDRDMGALIAQAVVKENISCVISTFGLPKVAQRQIIADFSDELLKINNTPRHIFIEEAHEFLPQRVFGAMGKVFAAVESLVVMGRNRGIGVTLINQRAATINKDVLTQVDTLLAFRNVAPQDRKALKEWVEHHSAEGDFNKFMESLPSLPTGEGWIWSPEFMGIFKQIKIRKRRTFHPDREKLGSNFEIPELEAADIQSFINRFNQSKDAKPKEKGDKSVSVAAPSVLDKSAEIALRNKYESEIVSKDAEILRLNRIIQAVQRAVGDGYEVTGSNQPVQFALVDENNAMLEKLGGMARKVYETLLKHPSGLTKRQVALMCAYAVTSGSFRNAISKLKTMGLISKDGELLRALTR